MLHPPRSGLERRSARESHAGEAAAAPTLGIAWRKRQASARSDHAAVMPKVKPAPLAFAVVRPSSRLRTSPGFPGRPKAQLSAALVVARLWIPGSVLLSRQA